MPNNALYTDLSAYYDLMCADIDYQAQSNSVRRLHQLFGNNGKRHLDLACGTGPHIRHFIDYGYACSGLDIHQPMLGIATRRCPEAQFRVGDMCSFAVPEPLDLITCFLYSIHYSATIARLEACIAAVYAALGPHGVFCFNAVDKEKIDNHSSARHTVEHDGARFAFESGWNYGGSGEQQSLKVAIERTTAAQAQCWTDTHAMVAVSFDELQTLLQQRFEVHVFEHDYQRIIPWEGQSGNALFVCVKV